MRKIKWENCYKRGAGQMKEKKQTNFEDRIFKHKLGIVYKTILIIVLIIALFAIIKIYLDNQVYSRFEVVNTVDRYGTSDSTYENYSGNVLVHSKDGISAYNEKGEQLWNQTYEMQMPIVKTNGKYVASAEYKGNKVYLMGEKGAISTIDTNMPILNLAVSAGGVVICELQDGDSTVYLKLFSKNGDLISDVKTSMRQSGYPLDFSVSPDNLKLGVSYLKAEGGKINSSLAFYNYGGVGQNETDNLVSGYDYEDEVYPLIIYPNEQNAVAVGDKQMRFFKGKQKPTLDVSVELEQEIQSVFYNENYIALVCSESVSGDKNIVRVYDMQGKVRLTYEADFAFSNLIVEDSRVILYNEARLVVIGMNDVIKYDGDLGGDIQSIVPVGARNSFIVVSSDRVRLIKLR